MNICLYGSSSTRLDEKYYQAARIMGEKIAERGHGMVFGGGAQGLMGAAAEGVTSRNGFTLGIAPSFFDKPGILFQDCSRFIFTETMRERKQLMEDNSHAFLMVPGGIGTYEEFFEVLTLKQLGRHNKPIAILNVDGYFDHLQELLSDTCRQGFMGQDCLRIYGIFTDPDQLLDYIEKEAESPTTFSHLRE